MTAKFANVKAEGKQQVRDLWRQEDLGTMDDKFEATVAPHGAVMIKLTPVK